MRRPVLSRVVTLFALALLAVPMSALADAGETGFVFLKLGVGARPMGLGSAYVALADDPTAVYWNPAGLATASGVTLTAMHNEWIQDFRQEFAAVAFPLLGGGAGVGLSGFYTSKFERRDDVGNLTGHFGFNDMAATLSYGRRFAPGVSTGLSVKYLREMIDEETATSVAVDLGVRYPISATGLSLGAAIQNVGSDATFVSEGFPIPRTLRLGAAWMKALPRWQGQGVLSSELRQVRGDGTRVHVGGEFEYRSQVALRAGAKFGYDVEDLSFGLGLKRGRFGFDYALVPLSLDLGTSHFLSLTAHL